MKRKITGIIVSLLLSIIILIYIKIFFSMKIFLIVLAIMLILSSWLALNIFYIQKIKREEEYKSIVFQSISHDLKTPLAVIKSHLEAVEDGMITEKEFKNIVKTQINTLDFKISSLIYSNKLNYLKDLKIYRDSEVDIKEIVNSSIAKFKYRRLEIKYKTSISGNTVFRGTLDAWETIIDNILNNFVRYAEEEIKITIKNNQIILFNDGPSIDENVFSGIFSPYKKSATGLFGLGLSIVKRTLNMLGYEITVKNLKKGISFTIHS